MVLIITNATKNQYPSSCPNSALTPSCLGTSLTLCPRELTAVLLQVYHLPFNPIHLERPQESTDSKEHPPLAQARANADSGCEAIVVIDLAMFNKNSSDNS